MRSSLLAATVLTLLLTQTNCKSTSRENVVISQMQTIGEKAALYFNAEHQTQEGPVTHVFPKASGKSCVSGELSEGALKDMGLTSLGPPDVSYCYQTDQTGKRFALSAEDQDVQYCIKGQEDSKGTASVDVVIVGTSSCEP